MPLLTEREQLARLVEQWNENRLELFHLSYPTEDLEIEGVMRFYFQEGGEKVLTKCVRVSSTATTRAVVDALADKFLPDLKMLTHDTYSLWEIHENGEERKLDDEEKPLLVQLMWHRDDREGRFLLRRDRMPVIPLTAGQLKEAENMKRGQKRYSKRDKNDKKKKHKDVVTVNNGREEAGVPPGLVSTDIYKQLPSNTFTRTISNPEVVMKKRRERKLESKLKEIKQGEGGSLKIYGGEVVPSRPYVTILASINDPGERILNEALEKYGLLDNKDDYVLVEMPCSSEYDEIKNSQGRIVAPDENPLMTIATRVQKNENAVDTYLSIQRKPTDYRVPTTSAPEASIRSTNSYTPEPSLVVLDEEGRTQIPQHHVQIRTGVTEVGSDRALSQFSPQNIYLDGPDIRGRHCVVTFMDGVVTITPSATDAYIEVNNRRLYQTEILCDGDLLRIGASHLFRFSSNSRPASQPSDSRAPTQGDYTALTQSMYAASLSGSSNASRQVSEHMGPAPHSINATNGLHLSRPVSNNNLPLALSNGVNIPINLEIGDYKVWDYVNEVISRGWSDCGSFRLSPAYALYLALRFFHSNSKPFIGQFFSKITTHLGPIARDCNSRDELLFWLANTSELTFLVENDSELRDSRANQLASMVETIFKQLCTVLTELIRPASQPMLDTNIDMEAGCAELIQLLDSTMREARTSRLNPALTIQVSGHMFHSVNATIFNALIGMNYTRVPLTSKLGRLLQSRLLQLHRWAEQMGVELAAECHLDRSRQAANLLVAHKNDLASLGTTCYKLNSLQVRYLLTNFDPKDGESVCDNDVINRVVGLAERQADQLTREDDLAVTLEESEYLALPFLLPQDGYVAEQLRDVPEGLARYLLSLQDKRVLQSVQILNSQNGAPKNCTTQQPSQTNGASTNGTNGNGQTTVLMPASIPQAPLIRSASQSTLTSLPTPFGDSFNSNVMQQDELLRVTLRRGTGGIGLSIVAAQGVGDRQVGIYVKKVVDGTPAATDGRLTTGDQLLSVNGHSLIGISQEEAAQIMSRSGPDVHFEVRKGAAYRNGLVPWLTLHTQTAPSSSNPSSLSASMPSPTQNGRYNPPPAYPMQKYGSQQSVQSNIPPPSYQKHQQITASRSSAFAPPTAIQGQNGHQQNQFDFGTRHVRSISASDLYQGQNDPNASFSQRSITSTTGNGNFDKLPAHYRASSRPMVIQPGRPCPSPSSLRRAQSPSSLYRPPSANGLNRPPSASELFAPPRSPNPLQMVGYSSNNRESHAQDLYRASMPSPPAAQSSPRASSEGFRPLPYSASASLPQPIFQKPTYQPLGGNHPPKAFVGPTTSGYQGQRQEPAIVRPVDVNIAREYERDTERQTTFGVIKGAVPTAITQALQLQQQQGGAPRVVVRAPRQSGVELDVRELERTNIALMSQDAVNDELDRLDAKGINMTESETMRYRELLNAAADQSRVQRHSLEPQPAVAHHINGHNSSSQNGQSAMVSRARVETLIDDVSTSVQARTNMRENISPGENRKKSVQFKDEEIRNEFDHINDGVLNSPAVIGTQEFYKDPRARRLNELQERQEQRSGNDGAQLGFRDKMRLFAHQIGENTPKQKIAASSAERHIANEQ